jgi:hypothetical protein
MRAAVVDFCFGTIQPLLGLVKGQQNCYSPHYGILVEQPDELNCDANFKPVMIQ